MQKFVFNILANLLAEIKAYKKYQNIVAIKSLFNNQIQSVPCVSVAVNDSSTASSFYGVIVYPNIVIRQGVPTVINYAIEIQRQAVDLLSPEELAAMIIHDVSHNVLSAMVIQRIKYAIFKACRITHSKIVDIIYNMTKPMWELAALDVSNRTLKGNIIPGLDMYEPDRLLVDMEISDYFNSALKKYDTIDYLNLSDLDSQEIGDAYIGMHIIKMVREKLRGINKTYNELFNYIKGQYDTRVFYAFPRLDVDVKEDRFGAEVLDEEQLKPYEIQRLQEGVVQGIKTHGLSKTAEMLLEASTAKTFSSGKISYSSLQRELDVLNFKIESMGSNYERLAILDRIYDNIFALEKYLEKNPNDQIIWDYLKRFIGVTESMKDAKIAKKKYGVFIEVPPGYEG